MRGIGSWTSRFFIYVYEIHYFPVISDTATKIYCKLVPVTGITWEVLDSQMFVWTVERIVRRIRRSHSDHPCKYQCECMLLGRVVAEERYCNLEH